MAVATVEQKSPVSKEEFQRYVNVQRSGVCNMLSPDVRYLADLTKEQHIYIIGHYADLEKEYDIHL